MAGPDSHTAEAEKAEDFKAKGNACFKIGDLEGAEKWYSIAFVCPFFFLFLHTPPSFRL